MTDVDELTDWLNITETQTDSVYRLELNNVPELLKALLMLQKISDTLPLDVWHLSAVTYPKG